VKHLRIIRYLAFAACPNASVKDLVDAMKMPDVDPTRSDLPNLIQRLVSYRILKL